jgi:hypothetical protein
MMPLPRVVLQVWPRELQAPQAHLITFHQFSVKKSLPYGLGTLHDIYQNYDTIVTPL